MKICFFLQRRWAQIGNAMAYHIKNDFPETEFCGFVNMRESLEFLQNQKDVSYTSLLLEQDLFKKIGDTVLDIDYIHWLEKEYGIPNLWPYVYVDRVIMNGQLVREYPFDEALLSHEDMLKYVQIQAKALIEFLDKEKPDALAISVIGSIGSSLLYHIARKRGIQTITFHHACIDNRIVLSEYYKNFSWVKERFNELNSGSSSTKRNDAENFIQTFREKPTSYIAGSDPKYNNQASRIAHVQFLKPKNLLKSVPWYIATFTKDLKKVGRGDYSDIFIWWTVWDKMVRKLRGLIGYDDLYSPVDLTERFAYYPLHFEPEITTLLYAPYYTNQAQLVRAIARSLPLDMKLYVKDHAPMLGYRTRSFYKEMLKIPNIKLIDPSVRGLDLVQKTELTFTITGTSGWESILLKKPVINFGYYFYNDIPRVKFCTGYDELPFLVKEQLEVWEHDEKAVVNYVSALLEDSVPADYTYLWDNAESFKEVRENDGIIALSRLLSKKVGLVKK